jgi:hypothetical protein
MAATVKQPSMVKMSKRVEKCIENTKFTESDKAVDTAFTKSFYELDEFVELIEPGEFDHLKVEEVQPGLFLSLIGVLVRTAHKGTQNIKKLISS